MWACLVLRVRGDAANSFRKKLVRPCLASEGGLYAFSLPSLATFPGYFPTPDLQGHVDGCSATSLRDVAAVATSRPRDPSGTQPSGEAQRYEQGLLEVRMGSWRGLEPLV